MSGKILVARKPDYLRDADELVIQDMFDQDIMASRELVERTPELEANEEYVQIIPYVLLFSGKKLWAYQRRGGDEGRLEGKASVGFGGHVEEEDCVVKPTDDDLQLPLRRIIQSLRWAKACGRREVAEEFGLASVEGDPAFEMSFLMNVYDPTSQVGRVHLGLVYRVNIDESFTPTLGKGLARCWLGEAEDIRTDPGIELEPWSVVILDAFLSVDPKKRGARAWEYLLP